jgi:hypothetical protein
MLVVHRYVTRLPQGSLWFKRRYTIIIDYNVDNIETSNVFKFLDGELLYGSDRHGRNKDFHIREPATLFVCNRVVYFRKHRLIV